MATDFSEHFIVTPDGLRLFVRGYAGSRAKTPVVCLHGLTRNSADFESVGPFVSRLGRDVYAMDVRGRGRSDRDPDPSRYRPDVYAQDVIHVLNALDVREAVFIGTSMGGLIMMVLAAMAHERIVASVLNDVGPVVSPVGLARIASYVGKSGPFDSWDMLVEAVRATQSASFPGVSDDFWRNFVRRVASEQPDGRIAFDYDPAISQGFKQPAAVVPVDLQPLFAGLAKKPTLVLRGELSDILAPEGVEIMRKLSPDLQVVQVPNVGHAPTLDEPVACDAIRNFLSVIR
jgi:pimeloyl-ACP methyl ester carboxylesterase